MIPSVFRRPIPLPLAAALAGCVDDFEVTLPPHSVNILLIPAK